MVQSEMGLITANWSKGVLGNIAIISSGKRPYEKSKEIPFIHTFKTHSLTLMKLYKITPKGENIQNICSYPPVQCKTLLEYLNINESG